jgi:multisubunit Na+/H+ antiporter MnhG subunit
LYLIFSKFFSEKQYTNKLLVLLLFLYLITPIILEHIINFAYEGYIYFLEYNNIKEDTKSYQDIVNKNIT